MTTMVFGSQRLLQVAVNRRTELLLAALRRSGAIGRREQLRWVSPLENDGYREYRDRAALSRLELAGRLPRPLRNFWPARGCVWDALGIAGEGRPILVEAKAHIAEAASTGSRASPKSRQLIEKSLATARRHYSPRNKADWTTLFYQYANRLAYHFFLHKLNEVPSSLVFLYFTNAVDMDGPATEAEWRGAIRLIHTVMGLPSDLTRFSVYHAFVDAEQLADSGSGPEA